MAPFLPGSKSLLVLPVGDQAANWLGVLREAISAGSGHAAYKEFWHLFSATTEDKSTAVKQAMDLLENLWDHDQFVAGYLMALLLHDAASAYRHDVADAIWLYLEDASSEALADATSKATVKRGPRDKSKFSRVVERMRAKNGTG